MLLRISTVHAIHFKSAPRVETQQNIELMTFVLTLCANIFVGCSVIPTFFQQITSFSVFSITLKNNKNLYVGSFNYISYTIQIGSNWYMDTGVRDLEVASVLRLIMARNCGHLSPRISSGPINYFMIMGHGVFEKIPCGSLKTTSFVFPCRFIRHSHLQKK